MDYPLTYSVEYPDRSLNRLTTLFRLFVALPILIVLATVSGGTWLVSSHANSNAAITASGGFLFAGPLLMILFRRKYPQWWFDWNRELLRFTNRVVAYLLLMDDHYPSTDAEQSVHLDIPTPT